MIDKILKFVKDFKTQKGLYSVRDNIQEIQKRTEKSIEFVGKRAKKRFLKVWNLEPSEESLSFNKISNLELDWDVTVDNMYIYGGFKNHAYTESLTLSSLDYESIACEHKYFTKEQEVFLKDETNWFTKSAHGSGEGTYGIFHRTKEKFPFDILFLDNGIYFKTSFTTESYYQALIDSMGICGWQYFYIDFEEIKKQCGDFKVGQRWLTVYPYSEGMSESPLGRNVTRETSRLDALVHHMEKCVYLLPKIFPNQDFSYHEQRLKDFKVFLER